jgi:hypothetical protein
MGFWASGIRRQRRGRIELLAQACAAADRAEALRAAVDRDGEVVQTRTGPRAHPGLRDELSNRAFIVRTLERLGLTLQNVQPVGRPTDWARRHAD